MLAAIMVVGMTASTVAGQSTLTLTPASMNFGSVPIGTTSSQTVQLKNTGTTSVTVSSATVGGKWFQLHGITTPLVLAGGKSASITVSYAPTVPGEVVGMVSFVSNATNKTSMMAVSGTGLTATRMITATPTTLSFGTESVGSSKVLSVVLKNTGNSVVTLSGVSITGAGITTSGAGASGSTIAPGQTATVNVSFAPKTAGNVIGSVKIASNSTTPIAIAVTGNGVTAPTASTLTATPASVSFGNVPLGTTNSQSIQLKNTGTASVTISSATVGGNGMQLRGITTPLVLAGGKTANVVVSYAPTMAGYVASSVSIASNAANKMLTMAVSGTGLTATRMITATPTTLSFGTESVGSSKVLSVVLKNTGNSVVTLSGVSITGAGITTSGAGASGSTIAPGQTATVNVSFAPKTAGNVIGSVKIASNSTTPIAIAVTGNGVTAPTASTLTATPASVSFGNVPLGTTNSQSIQLKNTGTASVTISSATVGGNGMQLRGITTPLVLAGGKTANVVVSYAPTMAGYVASSVSIASNAANKMLTMAVSGTGLTATRMITATPTTLSFGTESVGSSKVLSVVLKNTGNSVVTLSGVSITGAGITTSGAGASGSTIAPGQTATVNVSFAPKTAGNVIGSVKIASNSTTPIAIAVTGNGVTAPTASTLTATPASVSFGNVPLGTTNSQSIQLKNTGTASVTISSATVGGNGMQLRGITTPLVLAGGTTSNIMLAYTPTIVGYLAGSVSIASDAANKTLTMTVSGTGVAATRTITATPASLNFGNLALGSSKTLPVVLQNTGNSNVTLSGVTISGAGITTSGGLTGLTIAPGQTATVDVSFAPKTVGSVSGSVKLAANSTTSPTITVSGNGVSTAHSVGLNWDPSSSSGVTGYHVYRAIGTGAYTRLGTVGGLSYTDTAVASGTSYTYAVTAVDSAGMESPYSAAVSVTVP